MEAIILAGGLGTRLKPITKDMPKPMVLIGNKPFLAILLDYLITQSVQRVILSVGYKAEKIIEYFQHEYKSCEIVYSVETESLGTGGAILYALEKVKSANNIFILNGDTFFPVNFKNIYDFHSHKQADITIAIKPMNNFDRYGTVTLENDRIIGFTEKKKTNFGYINGGIYLLRKNIFDNFSMSSKFSFENDFLSHFYDKMNLYGYVDNHYFIDIGIPEDYHKANYEIRKNML